MNLFNSGSYAEKVANTFWRFVPNEFVVFDIEVTGQDYRNDKILEIGASLFNKRDYLTTGEVSTFQCFINQNNKISEEAQNRTGITDEMVLKGNSEYEALAIFFEFISDRKLLSYDSKFNRNFIIASSKYSKFYLEKNTFEVEDISSHVKKSYSHLPSRKLEIVANAIGFKTTSGHAESAVYKSAMALQVYLSLFKFHYEV